MSRSGKAGGIQRASKYTITNEKEFREQILAELEVRQEVDTSKNAEIIANAEARMKELDTLIGKLYETYALEKYQTDSISDL